MPTPFQFLKSEKNLSTGLDLIVVNDKTQKHHDNGEIKMKRLLIVLALIIAVAFSGCTEKGPNAGDIKVSMIKAAENLSSYNFTASQNQTEAINEYNNKTGSYNVNTTMRTAISDVTASIDLAGHRVKASLSTKTSMRDPDGTAKVSSSNGTQYNIGNVTYTRMGNGNWSQLVDPTPERELWASGRYNTLKARADAISKSEVDVLGSESVDGKDCYKLNLVMNNTTYYTTLYNAVSSIIFPFVANLNRTELEKNSKIETLVWVEKDSNLIRKYENHLSLRAVPDLVGIFNINSGQIVSFNQSVRQSIKPVEVSVDSSSLEHYYDFNVPMNIVPPKEALSTKPIVPVMIQNSTGVLQA